MSTEGIYATAAGREPISDAGREPSFRSMASIKNHFEQRADLDAFWAADVDYSKGRMGLQTTAQQVRSSSRPSHCLAASARNGLPSEPLDEDNSGELWLQTARTNAPWDFEAISGTLQAGITVIPDSTMRTTSALDGKRLSDLSMCASMYPGGDAALDTDDFTGTATGATAGKESQRAGTQVSQYNNSLAFNPLFNEAESGQVASANGETLRKESDGTFCATAEAVSMEGQLQRIAEELASPASPTATAEACQHLTALIVDNPAEDWNDTVAKLFIHRLLPHVTAASGSKVPADAENVAAARTAITALCAIASHGLESTSDELANQGAVSAAISAAQAALLPDPQSASEEAFNMGTAVTRGALLPIIRDQSAATVLARTRDAAAQPPLLALATLGDMALGCCDSSVSTAQNKTPAAVALVLSVLQCVHAMLSHGSLELLNACCQTGLLQLAIGTYALSHNPSVLPVHAWEMRKSLAVLAEVGGVFQAAEADALSDEMSCTQAAQKHKGKVALASDAVREAISVSTPGSAAALLALLVEDVKLRDRAHFASLAIRTLQTLLVHCGIKTADLSGQHIEAICAAGDGKVLKQVLEPFTDLLIHIWCDCGLMEADAKERARTAMARTLGRQQNLSSDTLTFIRQHVVSHCMAMLNWESQPQFAYFLRSFGKQDKSILKDLASGSFCDNMAAAASEGHAVASDVLLDLAACNSRISKRAAQCCVLENTHEMLLVASSAVTAINGILAIAAVCKSAWQALLWSLNGWLTFSSTSLKSDKGTAVDAVRVVELTAACMEALQRKTLQQQAGKAVDGIDAAAATAADLAVSIVALSSDPKVKSSAVAAMPILEPSAACFRRLCAPKLLAPAIENMRPSDAADINSILGSVLRTGSMHDGLVLQLLIQGDVSRACMSIISAILDQWDGEVKEGLQGAALTQTRKPGMATEQGDVQQAVAEGSASSGPGLVPTVPAGFVEQAAALHTAVRLCMAMMQAADASSARLPDPIAFLGDYRLYTLNEVAANNLDVRLKRTLEASTQILTAASTHQKSLPQAAPLLSNKLADTTTSVLGRIQAGTTSTVAQFQGVLQQWRGESTQGEVHRTGSQNGGTHLSASQLGNMQGNDCRNGPSDSGFRSAGDKLDTKSYDLTDSGKAVPEGSQRSIFNLVKVTSGQLVEGLQLQAEKARETISKTSIMRG